MSRIRKLQHDQSVRFLASVSDVYETCAACTGSGFHRRGDEDFMCVLCSGTGKVCRIRRFAFAGPAGLSR